MQLFPRELNYLPLAVAVGIGGIVGPVATLGIWYYFSPENTQVGYAPEQHAYARVDGQWVCIDNIAHNARPESFKSDAERQLTRELYPA